jgi:hypothetical protein
VFSQDKTNLKMYYKIFIKGKKNWGYKRNMGKWGEENFFYLVIQRFWALTGK